MLEELLNENRWGDYLNSKLANAFLSQKEKKFLTDFISKKTYLPIATAIVQKNYTFSNPRKVLISKKYTDKKRAVYIFTPEEKAILSYIAYLLYDYDYLFSFNLYSFRKSKSVKQALNNLIHIRRRSQMYGYKLDISNYFNSIDTSLLLEDIKKTLDSDIYELFNMILANDNVQFNRDTIQEDQKGAMAGMPIAAFLANFYLRDLDHYFASQPVVYFRYSDDILLFCNTQEERDQYVQEINDFLTRKHLSLNPKKLYTIEPGDPFEFLGFAFDHQYIDIGHNTVSKIQCSIHHKAKMLIKWADQKGVDRKLLIKVMTKKYNNKFFGNEDNELSWKYYYFPFINTSRTLKVVDAYLQDTLRYLVTKHHNKANYRACPYRLLKDNNYKSLVHEYYAFIKENNKIIIKNKNYN